MKSDPFELAVRWLCAAFQIQAFRQALLKLVWIMDNKGRYHWLSSWILPARVDMLNAMAAPPKDLDDQIRLWTKKNVKENSRLEFKLRIDVSTPGAKAEFIKDAIALANSEGG